MTTVNELSGYKNVYTSISEAPSRSSSALISPPILAISQTMILLSDDPVAKYLLSCSPHCRAKTASPCCSNAWSSWSGFLKSNSFVDLSLEPVRKRCSWPGLNYTELTSCSWGLNWVDGVSQRISMIATVQSSEHDTNILGLVMCQQTSFYRINNNDTSTSFLWNLKFLMGDAL